MKIKSKVHQQFYSLYLTFTLVIGLLLLSFYSVLKVNTYQVTENAIQSDLITALLSEEIKVLLMKVDITASYSNFYIFSMVCIAVCVLMLFTLFFKLNRRWKQTYLSHIDFMHTCIEHYEYTIDGKPVNNELFEEVKYSEQQSIAKFFVKLTLLSQYRVGVTPSKITSTDENHIQSNNQETQESKSTPVISHKDNSIVNEYENTIDTITSEEESAFVDIEHSEDKDVNFNTHKIKKVDNSFSAPVQLEAFDKQFELFDLHAFTEKQISPEFSVLLLEEYLHENKQLLDNIKIRFKDKNYRESLEDLLQLLSNVKVLSVGNLQVNIEALIRAIENADNQKVHPLIIELEEQLILFTQAVKL